MNAQVLYGINSLKYEKNYKTPELKEDEVLIKVKACGICGSDIDRVLKNGTYHFPTIIGHEFSGIVEKVKSDMNRDWLGKRVSIFPLIPCKCCSPCLSGNYQLCENYNYLGSRCDGGFAEFVAVPVWNLIEIPEGVSYEEAAMMEPTAVAMHSLRQAGNLLGKNVVITGAGTISSILVQLSLAAGASKVVVIARNEKKLDYIKNIVPNVLTINTGTGNTEGELNRLLGSNASIVIEGTGASNMIALAIQLVERQGVVVLMGNPSSDISLEKKVYWQIMRKELNLKGTWNSSYGITGKNDWYDVFELIKQKKINLSALISDKISLENLMDGIELMSEKQKISNKVMVVYEK